MGCGGSKGTQQPNSKQPFPVIKSEHSLVKKYVTPELWKKHSGHATKTSGFTLSRAIACAVQLDNQHVGIYAGDEDCYIDFKDIYHPIICHYHKLESNFTHKPNMNASEIQNRIADESPIISTRIRVARNIKGLGLPPGTTREQRLKVEELAKNAFSKLEGYQKGTYYSLQGMDEEVRKQMVADHFLFMSGDKNLQIAGMENDWPEGRGIFFNESKTLLVWVNEEDQLRIVSLQQGGNVYEVFNQLAQLVASFSALIQQEGQSFQVHDQYGFISSCPSNLGTGMRASVLVHLPGWVKVGIDKLKARCEELGLQPRGANGESGGMSGDLFDISNKARLGKSEVELVKGMIDGVNLIIAEDKQHQQE